MLAIRSLLCGSFGWMLCCFFVTPFLSGKLAISFPLQMMEFSSLTSSSQKILTQIVASGCCGVEIAKDESGGFKAILNCPAVVMLCCWMFCFMFFSTCLKPYGYLYCI